MESITVYGDHLTTIQSQPQWDEIKLIDINSPTGLIFDTNGTPRILDAEICVIISLYSDKCCLLFKKNNWVSLFLWYIMRHLSLGFLWCVKFVNLYLLISDRYTVSCPLVLSNKWTAALLRLQVDNSRLDSLASAVFWFSENSLNATSKQDTIHLNQHLNYKKSAYEIARLLCAVKIEEKRGNLFSLQIYTLIM